MAATIIPFPSPAASGNVDYIYLLKKIQQLARVADRDECKIKERIFQDFRRECIDAIRDAGIPFPDIVDGL